MATGFFFNFYFYDPSITNLKTHAFILHTYKLDRQIFKLA